MLIKISILDYLVHIFFPDCVHFDIYVINAIFLNFSIVKITYFLFYGTCRSFFLENIFLLHCYQKMNFLRVFLKILFIYF